MIDYIAIRRNHLGRVRNCKVVPGESIAAQHRLLIADLAVMRNKSEAGKERQGLNGGNSKKKVRST